MTTRKESSKTVNRKMVIRALTDPKFRRELKADPGAALGKKKLTDVQLKEVQLVLAAVKGIDQQVANLADELLCANGGGGCSIG